MVESYLGRTYRLTTSFVVGTLICDPPVDCIGHCFYQSACRWHELRDEMTIKSRSVSGNLLPLWLRTLQVLLSESCSDSAGGDVED